MILSRRKPSSNRLFKPTKVEMYPHFAGWLGDDGLTFKVDELWHKLIPETIEDVRLLQSAVGCIAHNFEAKEQKRNEKAQQAG